MQFKGRYSIADAGTLPAERASAEFSERVLYLPGEFFERVMVCDLFSERVPFQLQAHMQSDDPLP